ncbi:alpha/beta-hydrolase family protein [Gordonia sp. NPDC003424]
MSSPNPASSSVDRYARRGRWPHPAVDAMAFAGALIALWPCGLPRPAPVSGLLTAACVGPATAAGLALTRRRAVRPAAEAVSLVAAAGGLMCLGVMSRSWQDALRAEVGAPHATLGWWLVSVVPAMVLFCAIVWVPRATALAVAAVAALLAGYLPAARANGPSVPHPAVEQLLVQGDASDPASGARALASRWTHTGGLDRRHVVIAVPTGSGWIDRTAVTGFVDRFDGDAVVLSLQYAHESSWRAFVGDRSAAGRSATALLREIIARRDLRSPGDRPAIHLYGQSLGAIGADEARAWAAVARPGTVTDTMLAGVPADTVGTIGDVAGGRRTVIANESDPVARWSIALLWRPARLPSGTVLTGRAVRQPPWLPVIGFLQTSVDLLSSLDGPAGVGHRYANYPIGPRAAS